MKRATTILAMVVALAATACGTTTAQMDVSATGTDVVAGEDTAAFGDDVTDPPDPAEDVLESDVPEADIPEPDVNPDEVPFPVVDTGQDRCFDDQAEVACEATTKFAGQDAQYHSFQPKFVDNGDGTVTDLVTGLMWQQDPGQQKLSQGAAAAGAGDFGLAGYDDWRLPTIKELYTLIDFTGVTAQSAESSIPYIDTDYFVFRYGDESAGERFIDAQYATSTLYVSTTMNGDATMFGVNFADGRIKGYGLQDPQGNGDKTFYVMYVRGSAYGDNDFVDNGDGTVADEATGLTWQQSDDGTGRDWGEALAYCESLTLAGENDWRLPNAKELQGIVDYTRSPDTTNSAAIDPIFAATEIDDPEGAKNYAFYWTSTTHLDGMQLGSYAVYVAFGEAQGFMEQPPDSGNFKLMDVHGAGAQRSDPKAGNPDDYPTGHGPQGDVIGIYNLVRCVRGGGVNFANIEPTSTIPAVDDPDPQGDCGDGFCEPGEEMSCPDDCGGEGPVACETESDCQGPGACPDDAPMGCTCAPDPMGEKMCVPACQTDNDCPNPPDLTLICAPEGICIPEGGGPPR